MTPYRQPVETELRCGRGHVHQNGEGSECLTEPCVTWIDDWYIAPFIDSERIIRRVQVEKK